MKHVFVSLLAAMILAPAVQGQDVIRPSEIGISFNFHDYTTAQLIRATSLNAVIMDKQFAKIKNMSPGFGLHYFKGLEKHIDFAGSVNASFLSHPFPNKPDNSIEKFLLQVEGAAQFKMVSDNYWFQPFLIGGFGAQKYSVYYGAYIPLGVGLNINFFNEGRIFINSTYRVPITTGSANYHFMHAFGISGRIGKKKEPAVIPPPPPPPPPPKDTDNDGIIDDNDKCPTVAGVVKYEGCPVPDTDKDGINDDNDKCPTVAGLAKYQGCPVPDTDKDGINDELDKCPNQAGIAKYEGCPIPDTDKDGINDEEDKCPGQAGPASNNGCPISDRDKDGINDEEDKCPDVPGVAKNNGCPEVPELPAEVSKMLSASAQKVSFSANSAKLSTTSNTSLNQIVKIMNDYPELKLKIEGHTDNVEKNADDLSEQRAAAVKTYLASKGISADRIEVEGNGSSTPIADNNTTTGRAKNRRVEVKITY